MKPLKILALAVSLATPVAAQADIAQAQALQAQTGALDTYRNVLPLEGGSNFRDMGGYQTRDGHTVRRGLLYRSGVMTGLTADDVDYLADFDFATVVDLRSSEERELFPNRWAKAAEIDYISLDYSMIDMMKAGMQDGERPDMATLYKSLPYSIKPQLKQYFAQAVAGHAPLVVNCSAGQDRTGIASALMLTALDVPRSRIVQDYVLSTEYRRPAVERGGVDIGKAAETNAFAKMMLRYADKEQSMAAPLITEEGVPYLVYALQQIEADYGSVLAFMDKELGVGDKEIAALKRWYLL
ncbi:tyrosine-protein phosphatase [Parahaliea mediterranea]|uniref:tyrosine-protein phosphatase n=1 Tax=Parahaliea mediterranea TaxID=651086 RepID=UPI000E2E8D67|nr:tyrosine-protein phosphatase [Parahaliea mediterranea]